MSFLAQLMVLGLEVGETSLRASGMMTAQNHKPKGGCTPCAAMARRDAGAAYANGISGRGAQAPTPAAMPARRKRAPKAAP